jgi:hypothetical protein
MRVVRSADFKVGTAGALLGVAIASTCWLAYSARGRVASDLTYDGLLSIAVGARGGDVVGKIGYPLEVRASGHGWMAPVGRHDDWPDWYVWIYAKPRRWLFFREGLAVYIGVRNDQVLWVHAKYDDLPVYSRPDSEDRPEWLQRLKEELGK